MQKELEAISATFQQVSQFRAKFVDFDVAGKEIYLEQVSAVLTHPLETVT